MTIEPGTTLLHYRLVEKIGEGGMGVVWRATDTTLGRDVAVKILPDLFSNDPGRLSRFEREAKLLASLSHPGIATIHGLHESGGVRFLVMELVPGSDLARRLDAGPLPPSEALGIAVKIAEALEAAHEQGVVHRDLKPANVQVTPDGAIKILDFGLAKVFDAQGSSPGSGVSISPTLTTPASTHIGMILGTASYMSPEQAKGKPVDRRTDIWAFGCILYEMLAGRRPFLGEGVSEVLAAVIMAPVDFEQLPASTPERVSRLVRRCLERDPRRRLRDSGEARVILEDVLSGKPEDIGATAAAVDPPTSRATLVASVAGAAILASLATAGAFRTLTPTPPERPVRRFEIAAPGPFQSSFLSGLVALSPDGKAIAYLEAGKIRIRRLSRLEPVTVETAAEPTMLFWSHDSSQVGFAAGDKLWRAPAGGGGATAITDIPPNMSGGSDASWCPDGTVVLTTGSGGILSVPSAGGDLREIVPIEAGKETDLHEPVCLPNGGLLFVPHPVNTRPHSLWMWAAGKRRELLSIEPDQDIWSPVYSPAGFILYHRRPANSGLWALPFSLAKKRATGAPFLVAPEGDVPSVSRDGTLAYVKTSGSRLTQAMWVDRTGKPLGKIGPPQEQWPFPELSPDGRLMAIAARDGGLGDIWIHDVARGTRTRLSATNVGYSTQAWSPDGKSLVYTEGSNPPLTMKLKAADGSGAPRELGQGWAPSFSRDGRRLLHAPYSPQTDFDLAFVDPSGSGGAVDVLKDRGMQSWPRLSPDERYVAYTSDESGDYEVYLRPFSGDGRKWQVSVGGGAWPRWSPKGDRLYYAREESVMEVDVTLGAEVALGAPRELFRRQALGWTLIYDWPPGFDVTPDGNRFVVIEPVNVAVEPSRIFVVENWASEFPGADR